MKRTVLVTILALSLVGAWVGVGAAGQIGYSMRSTEKGFEYKPNPDPPSSAVMFFDCLIGRPLGAAATVLGTALFVAWQPPDLPLRDHQRGGLGVGEPARRLDLVAAPGRRAPLRRTERL